MVPRTMSTQHPDNAFIPFFAREPVLSGEDEVVEAFYAFDVLGIEEQMWDFEGKEVDDFVVKKLLEKYPYFFKKYKLGEELRITPRVPNPTVERVEAKLLLETLQSITRSADYAKTFYGEDIAPIFEVILPMTTSANEINRVYELYKKYIAGIQNNKIWDIKIKDWIGDFFPEEIAVIPLFEDKQAIINSPNILEEYLKDKDVENHRVFYARSDPALNYGMISAVIYTKYALYKLQELEEEISIDIYPIIGVGSPPFRGGLSPKNVDNVLNEYRSVQTFTIQSSFKYDNPQKEVINAIEKIKETKRKRAGTVDEEVFSILEKYEREYAKQVKALADIILKVSKFVPSRRKRKLHIGLFGYSRSLNGYALPRAIKFTASLYSLGIPPELLGLNALTEKEIGILGDYYINIYNDIGFAFQFFNPKVIDKFKFLEDIWNMRELFEFDINKEHLEITTKILAGNVSEELIIHAASVRGFLG